MNYVYLLDVTSWTDIPLWNSSILLLFSGNLLSSYSNVVLWNYTYTKIFWNYNRKYLPAFEINVVLGCLIFREIHIRLVPFFLHSEFKENCPFKLFQAPLLSRQQIHQLEGRCGWLPLGCYAQLPSKWWICDHSLWPTTAPPSLSVRLKGLPGDCWATASPNHLEGPLNLAGGKG